jgi:chloride channel protein, CIC family
MASLQKLLKLFNQQANNSTGRLFFASILIGIVSGLGAVLFFKLLGICSHYCFHLPTNYFPPEPMGEVSGFMHGSGPLRWWIILLVPAIGGLISGFIVFKWAPEAEGHGTDAMIEAFHQHKGFIRKRVPFIKSISSIITIGTGGSAGREGPIAQIGAGFGSYLSHVLRLSDEEKRILLLAGAAGGIGAIFRSPLGGALFAVEVLYKRDFEAKALIPALVSSIVAYSVFTSVFGWGMLFDTPTFIFDHPIELLFYGVFGFFCAFMGLVYIKVFYGFRDKFFKPIPIAPHFKPAIGGLMIGVLGVFAPYILASGYGYLQDAMNGNLTIQFMLIAALLKIFATSFTISSGGSGGVFAPSLFIGGMLGGAFGQFFAELFPGAINNPTAFVLVGMGAFFAGAAKVPISSMIMVSEMTGGYQLLVPMMLSSSTAYMALGRTTLYEQQVNRMADSPANMGDFTIDVLDTLDVESAYQPNVSMAVINETAHLVDFQNLVSERKDNHFPVISSNKEIVGIISLKNVRSVLFEAEANDVLIARDLMTNPVTVTRSENLRSALKKFMDSEYGQIPVVDFRDEHKIIGVLGHEDVIEAYNKEVKARKVS